MKKAILAALVLTAGGLAHGASTAFSGTFILWPQWVNSKTAGSAVVSETIGQIYNQAHTFGTNAAQMNAFVRYAGSLTNGEERTFNLQGGVSNSFGDAVTFKRVNFLAIKGVTNNAGEITVGDAAANPFTGWIGGTNPTVSVGVGGMVMAYSPDATGYAVATNSNSLKIQNATTNASLGYELYIGGVE